MSTGVIFKTIFAGSLVATLLAIEQIKILKMHNAHIACKYNIYIYMSARKAECMGSNLSVRQIFYFFRCVLSSLLPLRSVGRSNFDKGFNNVDYKAR